MAAADRILVIDDDQSIRKVLSMILAGCGYTVDAVGSGEEALGKLDICSYNLALVDVRLPDIQCTRLLTLLYEKSHRMLKVILTGFPLSEDALRTISQGVDGYLAKPINIDQLLKTVRQLLDRQAKERASAPELSAPQDSCEKPIA
jgi:DNA-binding response OmpR family regulator